MDVDLKKCGSCTEREFFHPGIKVHPSCEIGYLDPSSLKVVRITEKYEPNVSPQAQSKKAKWILDYYRGHTPKDYYHYFPRHS